jgi:hypothetical protein
MATGKFTALLTGALVACLGTAQAGPTTAPTPSAPPIDLRLIHHTLSIGKDGVQRESRYTDRMVRRDGVLWVEREMPAALREHAEHEGAEKEAVHIGHAHADTTAAPLWVQRDASGKVKVRMVLQQQRKVIEVDEANFGNVGWGGSWNRAYWIVDPATLSRMRAVGPARQGVQRYESTQGETTVRIDWDVSGQYPRRVEKRDAHGLAQTELRAVPVAAGKTLPWQKLSDFAQGDYSDLLD